MKKRDVDRWAAVPPWVKASREMQEGAGSRKRHDEILCLIIVLVAMMYTLGYVLLFRV